MVESLDLKYRDRLVNRLEEEQEEEEDFFSAVAFSINRVGQWCLELFMHHDKMLPSLEHQQRYENILTRLLKVSIRLLDTQKPLIGRKIVEFLSFWL